MHFNRCLVILGVVLVALLACKKNEAAATIEQHRPQVEPRLATAKRIAAELRTLAPLTQDGATLDAGPLTLSSPTNARASDTAVMEPESLLPHLESSLATPYSKAGQLAWCARLLGNKYTDPSKSVAEQYLGLCANAKYLLVVRELERKDGTVGEDKSTFQAGKARGEVRVFRLDSGKALGGFRFEAENSDLVSGRDEAALRTDLNNQLDKAVNAGIEQHLGGS